MKKFIAVVAVFAMTLVASVAMAEVTMDGSIEFLMRSFKNTSDWNDATTGAGDYQSTYERLRIGMNAKNDGAKGRIQLDTDWDQWADSPTVAAPNPGFETRQNGTFAMREGWLDFNIPGAGTAHIKVGRQFLQLGNGWFLQSRKYGSDAWLLGMPGKNTVAFVNIKASENNSTLADDTDAYALLDTFKIDDNNTVGIYFARANDRRGTWTQNAFGDATANNTILDNIGLHYSGKVGPLKLQAEVDFQQGKIKHTAASGDPDLKFAGSQFVVQAQLPMDAVTFNATLASGSGDKEDAAGNTGTKIEQYMTFLDKDPRYAAVYEYVMNTATGFKNTGFANTMAIGLGGSYKLSKMFSFNLDLWLLSANEKVALNGGAKSDDLGNEIDFRVNANITDQVSWYVNFGYFMTGDAYKSGANADPNLNGKNDDVTAIQSVLAYKF